MIGALRRLPAAPYAGIVLLGVLAYLLPYLSPTGKVLSLATSAAIFAIGGSGLGFLWGQSGQLTLAHAAVFGLGGYGAALSSKFFGLGFVAALPVSLLTGIVAGALVALPSLRTAGHYFVILTFAVGEVIAVFEMRIDWLTGGANGITTPVGTQQVLGYGIAQRADYYSLVILFATVVLLLLCALMRSRWGVILRAMRENVDLALSLGVNIKLHRLLAFAVSGAIAGLAGHLFVYQVKYIAPILFTAQTSIILLLVVLLGGKSYLLGPAVGAVVYHFLPHFIHLTPIQTQIAFGAILVVMILTAPKGLLSLLRHLPAFVSGRKTRTPDNVPEEQQAESGRLVP